MELISVYGDAQFSAIISHCKSNSIAESNARAWLRGTHFLSKKTF